jgi:CheY-like chemotaxis protein
MTILLVEDHTDTRQAIRMWLEMCGHSVIEAHDVRPGLAAGARFFDLLLCDIGLPDGDGWTLLQTLSKSRSITAIAISGYCSPADVARSKAAGFLAHLAKPFSLEEFDAAVIASQDKRHSATRVPERNRRDSGA